MTESAALGPGPEEPPALLDPDVAPDPVGSRLAEALTGLGWMPPAEWRDEVDVDRLEQVAAIVQQSLAEDTAIARSRARTAREAATSTRARASAARRGAAHALQRSTDLAAGYRAVAARERTRPPTDGERSDGLRTSGSGTPEGEVAELRVEVAQLRRALTTRALIGQATGAVMYGLRCSPEAAWQALRALSQNSNTPIRELAASIVAQVPRGRVRELEALRRYVGDASGRLRPRDVQ